jgi:site-specific DNA-cytosine methylase
MNNINVLIACEESQTVCKAFRDLGLNAFSCDIQECSGGHPEWHIKGDVLPLLNRVDNGNNGWHDIYFSTMDGNEHSVEKWDLIIAHPPCTHLCVSGARHFEKKRSDGRQEEAIKFFCKFLTAECDRIAIENPVGIISGKYIEEFFPDIAALYGLPKKASQIIQPYEYGDPHKKTTCLWLKGLPQLKPTNIVEPKLVKYTCKNGKVVTFSEYMMKFDGEERSKHRSKTFEGIAKAMADQWGKYVWYQKYGGST